MTNETPEKTRLFVDMDGTLAVFKTVDTLETLYEPGYFSSLAPHQGVVDAVKELTRDPATEVFILSSVLSDSAYALGEKNAWLDKYLSDIPAENRIFPPCGEDKKQYVPGGIRGNDFLLDDYSLNLHAWEPPARGIKLLNGINHTKGSWLHDRLDYSKSPIQLASNIKHIMEGGETIKDPVPNRPSVALDEKTAGQTFSNLFNAMEDAMDTDFPLQETDLTASALKPGPETSTDKNPEKAKRPAKSPALGPDFEP